MTDAEGLVEFYADNLFRMKYSCPWMIREVELSIVLLMSVVVVIVVAIVQMYFGEFAICTGAVFGVDCGSLGLFKVERGVVMRVRIGENVAVAVISEIGIGSKIDDNVGKRCWVWWWR